MPQAILGMSAVSPRRSWTARPYVPCQVDKSPRRQAAPSQSQAPSAGMPSSAAAQYQESVLDLLTSGESGSWKSHNAFTYKRNAGAPQTPRAFAPVLKWQLGSVELQPSERFATISAADYVNPADMQGYSPRATRSLTVPNVCSDAEHELFARRSDRVSRALPQAADSYRPLPPAAYRSPRDAATSSSRRTTICLSNLEAATAYATTTTASHFKCPEYSAPRQQKRYEDTPRLIEHAFKPVEHAYPEYHKGHDVLAMLLQPGIGEAAKATGQTRRMTQEAPWGLARKHSQYASDFSWPSHSQRASPRRPPPGQGRDLIR